MNFVHDFGILFLIIVVISFFVNVARQPIIIGYVLSGIFFSLFLVNDAFTGDQIISMSELGITFLLFLMGLEFDLKSLKYLGKDILISSAIQSIVFFAMAFIVGSFFGLSDLEKVYLSILFMFSSTLLVAKLLEDKHQTQTLHAKISLGWDSDNSLETIKILEKCKVEAIAVHARTRQQLYNGSADWNAIKKIKENSSVPIIGNGDIKTANNALSMLNRTKCDFAMIGRSAIGNPFIFKDCEELFSDQKNNPNKTRYNDEIDEINKIRRIKQGFKEFIELYDRYENRQRIPEIRQYAMWFVQDISSAREVRNRIMRMEDRRDIIREIERLY